MDVTRTVWTFTPRGGPEELFGVGDATERAGGVRLEMAAGRWTLDDDGALCAGALGVLVDDALGNAMINPMPDGYWPVSTEISVDVVARPPGAPNVLTAVSHRLDDLADGFGGGALAQGRVLDGAGRTIAVATMRGRYVPVGDREPLATYGTIPPGTTGRREAAPGVSALLGGAVRRRGADVEFALPADPAFTNPLGVTHGGILLCGSEIAGRRALCAAGASLTTASVHIAYLRPVPTTGPLMFTAEVVHSGRTLGVARVTGRAVSSDRPGTVATVICHDETLPATS